jgi:hypothetical protein
MSTRREFLRHLSAVSAAVMLARVTAFGKTLSSAMKDIPLDELSYAALAAQLNSTFRVRSNPGHTVKLELIEASLSPEAPRKADRPAPRFERFSLLFRGAADELLEQKIHRFEQEQIGRFEMFIVPIGSRDKGHVYYEAVFNRAMPNEPAGA